MVGITLSAEQVRAAPPEVRHWIEQQVAGLFGGQAAAETHPASQALASCSTEEVRAILAQIQTLLPVVSVFFELGREPAGSPGQGVRTLSVDDVQRHARLRSVDQVMECVDIINQALAAIRGDRQAMVCAFDSHGRCFIADTTARSIMTLWHEIVAARGLDPAPAGRTGVTASDAA